MQKLSWKNMDLIIDELVKKIKASKFVPDCLVAIATSGVIPLYFLSKKLKVKNIFTISLSGDAKEVITGCLPDLDLKGKKLLLIDEITETGTSLRNSVAALTKKYSPLEIKTATFAANKDKCKFYPDFYVLTEQGEWIAFPWEKDEKWVKENVRYS